MSALQSLLWNIYTVWRRNFFVFRKTWLFNLLPPFSEPVVYLVGFGYGLGSIVGNFEYKGVQVTYMQFVASGMVCVALLLQSFFEASYGTFIRSNYQKTWNSILTTPVTFAEVYCGELLWAATKGLFASFVTACIGAWLGAYPLKEFFLMFPLFFLGGISFAAFGLCASALSRTIEHLQIPVFVFLIPMFSLCGAYFPIEGLPYVLKLIVQFLPFTPFVEMGRLYIVTSNVNIIFNIILLLIWVILCTGISYKLLKRRIIT